MPRVRADASVLQQAAKQHPREFAILAQLASNGKQDVDSEALVKFAKTLGDERAASAIAGAGEINVDQFVNVFKKPGQGAEGPGNCLGYATHDTTGTLTPWRFDRRDVRPGDVKIKITHAGICHSDLHAIRGEWPGSTYPMVPGHEIVGIVVEVGAAAAQKGWQLGDRAGVGCFVDACWACDKCSKGEQQFCRKGLVLAYNAKDYEGNVTYGGYSTDIVVDHKSVLHLPDSLPLDAAAPLLCAGITVYSPLKYYRLNKPGTRLAVNGLGGLGHMAVKFGVAMGCNVTVLSRSKAKEEEARALGAQHYLVSTDPEAMKAAAGSFDGIIDSVSAEHDVQMLVDLLDVDGQIVLVGAPPTPSISASQMSLLFKRASIGGSLIGGIEETQEMLDFCGKHGVVSDVEVIPASYLNTAMDRLAKGDVKFRFVIDIQGTLL